MPNEYNSDGEIVLRDSGGNQMSLPAFFKLALRDNNGNYARPTNARAGHYAWDMGTAGALTVPARTPVYGTVSECGDGWNGGMGTYAIVSEPNGRQHRFMHMVAGSLLVTAGAEVSQGDQLGTIGNTGDSYGAHLHYDVMVNGSKINDPIDAYDSSTLPTGWNFADAVDNGNNWDYIPLDSHTDFGPPGGDTPSEPFFTDKRIYDLSMYQTSAKSIELASDSTTGGFIIKWGQANSTSNYWQDTNFTTHLANARAANIPVGCYFYWEMNPDGLSDTDIITLFNAVFQYLTAAGITPETTPLGLWLDFEGSHSATRAKNDHVVELFNQVGTSLGFPIVGFYTYKNFLDNHFTIASVREYPFWYSRPGERRATIDSELASYGFSAAYLWQDGYPDGGGWSPDISYTHQDVDNDTVLQPIPTAGGGGGGGDDYDEVIDVTVDVVPPKRIYFEPNPGLLNPTSDLLSTRSATIALTTDAQNAILYYTIDGSSPYQYTTTESGVVYAVAANALRYTTPIIIHKDTHIRVVAVPDTVSPSSTFDEPLAKGSGTYLFAYRSLAQSWDLEKQSYATSDDNTSFFEENLQAFLRLHTQRTEEEILYTEVHIADTQIPESDAQDDASGTGSEQPIPEPPDTDIDNQDNIPEVGE